MSIRCAIKKVAGRELTLQNISIESDQFVMSEEQVDDIFTYSRCATCHSSQGASIKRH